MHRLVCSCLAIVFITYICASEPTRVDLPFPDIVHVEKIGNPLEESLMQQIGGYNFNDVYFDRIHNDAYYHIFGCSDNGDVVQLLDGSKWSIHPSQREQVLYWVKADDIFIKPCVSCFSSYKYVLFNRYFQKAVKANLIYPPLPMGAATFLIVNLEPYTRLVHLSDNTVWQIHSNDSNFSCWQKGQRILVGLNNRWRTDSFAHILINVDISNAPYSLANFYGYPVSY